MEERTGRGELTPTISIITRRKFPVPVGFSHGHWIVGDKRTVVYHDIVAGGTTHDRKQVAEGFE